MLRWIREQPDLSHVHVVVMSGSKNDADIEKAYSLGAHSYLVKPTKFEDLVKMMESLKDYATWRKSGKSAGGRPLNFNSNSSHQFGRGLLTPFPSTSFRRRWELFRGIEFMSGCVPSVLLRI